MNTTHLAEMLSSLRWFRKIFGNKLTTSQLEILLYIAVNPNRSIKEISADLEVDHSYVSKTVSTFEKGYKHISPIPIILERYTDRYSKRIKRIHLNAHGCYIFSQLSNPNAYKTFHWYLINPAKELVQFCA